MGKKTFNEHLKSTADTIDQAMASLLPEEKAFPPTIHEAMRYSALSGGKRIRGILLMEAARLKQDTSTSTTTHATQTEASFIDAAPYLVEGADVTPQAIQSVGAPAAAAAAIEMIHTYSLIHDDLPAMDDDDFRRGQPTTHKVYGEGIAILAGDALLTRAFEVLAALVWAGVHPARCLRMINHLSRAAGSVRLIGGQTADILAENRTSPGAAPLPKDPAELLTYIHMNKTAALIRSSLFLGGCLANLDDDALRAIDRYGQAIGLMFQIADDLLDVHGDEEVLGKATGSDQERGKLTYPGLYGTDAAKEKMEEQRLIALESLESSGLSTTFFHDFTAYLMERQF